MALSKSTRILILLAIDSAFFLLELIVGYAVHSLALVADSFHMLNDVLSLCVGLWAVKVAGQKGNSRYTYGWQRAETLGALVNGVFLVALCLSIFLEAIQRFVEPQKVSNPKLVLIVGCFGLASNILGLFLFHDHGHSHGGNEGAHSHAHKNGNELSNAEEGNGSLYGAMNTVEDEAGRVADIMPQNVVRSQTAPVSPESPRKERRKHGEFTRKDEEVSTDVGTTSPISTRRSLDNQSYGGHHRHHSGSRSRLLSSPDSLNIHPATFRNDIIAAARLESIESAPASDSETGQLSDEEATAAPTENSSLLKKTKSQKSIKDRKSSSTLKGKKRNDSWHADHKHSQPKAEETKGGHSHSDLNMRGVFLHVMGDALGNIGVIGSALIIWLTPYPWRFYSDPAISLVITCIILASAIPLCKAASRILLQAVPAGIDVDDIKADITELPGIISCHHLHVWQLNDTKMIASLHVQVGFDFEGEGSARYMALALAIRRCLHEYGIHSSTIQPEFCLDRDHDHTDGEDGEYYTRSQDSEHCSSQPGSKRASKPGSVKSGEHACLLDCGDDCATGEQCCAPGNGKQDNLGQHGQH